MGRLVRRAAARSRGAASRSGPLRRPTAPRRSAAMSSLPAPSGIYSAQWIPTDALGRIDRPSLAAHIEFERRAGISGVLALGSTGEFPFFDLNERKKVLDTVAELAAPLPVFANISDISPRAASRLTKLP